MNSPIQNQQLTSFPITTANKRQRILKDKEQNIKHPAVLLIELACNDIIVNKPSKRKNFNTRSIKPSISFEQAMVDIIAYGKSQEGNSQHLFDALQAYFTVNIKHSPEERLRALKVMNDLFRKSKNFRLLICGPYLRHFVHFCIHGQESNQVKDSLRLLLTAWKDDKKFSEQFGFVLGTALHSFAIGVTITTTKTKPTNESRTTTSSNTTSTINESSMKTEWNLLVRGLKVLDGSTQLSDPLNVSKTITSVLNAINEIHTCLEKLIPMYDELIVETSNTNSSSSTQKIEWEDESSEDENNDIDYDAIVAQATMHIPDDYSIIVGPSNHTMPNIQDDVQPRQNNMSPQNNLLHQYKILRKHSSRIHRWDDLIKKLQFTHSSNENLTNMNSVATRIHDIKEQMMSVMESCERCIHTI
jgi:hypothetical protein